MQRPDKAAENKTICEKELALERLELMEVRTSPSVDVHSSPLPQCAWLSCNTVKIGWKKAAAREEVLEAERMAERAEQRRLMELEEDDTVLDLNLD